MHKDDRNMRGPDNPARVPTNPCPQFKLGSVGFRVYMRVSQAYMYAVKQCNHILYDRTYYSKY